MPGMYEALVEYLQARAIPFVMHAHEPIQTVEEAREKWPLSLDYLVKTVAFRQNEGGVILAVARPLDRIDYARLAALLGINRRALHPLSEAEVEMLLGVPAGGVFPLPLAPAVERICFDQAVPTRPRIYCGSGRLDRTLELATAHLLELAGGPVDRIVK